MRDIQPDFVIRRKKEKNFMGTVKKREFKRGGRARPRLKNWEDLMLRQKLEGGSLS